MRMKRFKTMLPVLVLALLSPAILLAQPEEKVKEKTKEKKEVQQITITRKGNKKDKIVVEINGDKVSINGKPIEEYKEDEVKVMLNNLKELIRRQIINNQLLRPSVSKTTIQTQTTQ